LENDLEKALNLKWVLSIFEQMSDMRINFDKCDLVPINVPEEQTKVLSQVFGCKVSKFPLKYLGVPLHYSKLRKDLQPLIDSILKRAAGWRGTLLSYAARITLIQSCLSSIPAYLLSAIKFPSWTIKAINSQMAHCLWITMRGIISITLLTGSWSLWKKSMAVWVSLILESLISVFWPRGSGGIV
jgi:hypothetical protein